MFTAILPTRSVLFTNMAPAVPLSLVYKPASAAQCFNTRPQCSVLVEETETT